MDIPWKRYISKALLVLCLPLAVAGCGDDDDGGAGGGAAVITGNATKGPIKGAHVGVYQLSATGARGAPLGSGTTGNDGSFAVSIPASQAANPLLITVTGQPGATYASESTGTEVPFTAAESFNAVVDSGVTSREITVSPLTEAAFQILPQVLAATPGPDSAAKLARGIVAANARIGSLFGIGDILADPAGDPTHRTALLIIDQMIVDSKASGAVTDTAGVTTLLNNAFADVGQPGYQSYLTAFNSAADQVKIDNPGLTASIVDDLKDLAANPPAEPDFTDTIPPTAPTGLSATASALTATTSSIAVSWSPSTDNVAVAGYDVFRDGSKVATVATPGYTDPSLTSGVTYSYVVIAFDAVGNRSAASTPLSVTPNPGSLGVTISGQVDPG